jgi:hypothetical protein
MMDTTCTLHTRVHVLGHVHVPFLKVYAQMLYRWCLAIKPRPSDHDRSHFFDRNSLWHLDIGSYSEGTATQHALQKLDQSRSVGHTFMAKDHPQPSRTRIVLMCSWWFLMGSWWFLMAPDGFLMVPDGFMMVPDSSWWVLMHAHSHTHTYMQQKSTQKHMKHFYTLHAPTSGYTTILYMWSSIMSCCWDMICSSNPLRTTLTMAKCTAFLQCTTFLLTDLSLMPISTKPKSQRTLSPPFNKMKATKSIILPTLMPMNIKVSTRM